MCVGLACMRLLNRQARSKSGGSVQEGQSGVLLNLQAGADCLSPVRRPQVRPTGQIQELNISAGICLCKTRSIDCRQGKPLRVTMFLFRKRIRPATPSSVAGLISHIVKLSCLTATSNERSTVADHVLNETSRQFEVVIFLKMVNGLTWPGGGGRATSGL